MKGHAFRSTATCVSNSLEASGNNQLFQKFIPGDIAWIKIHNNSWWPGQVFSIVLESTIIFFCPAVVGRLINAKIHT